MRQLFGIISILAIATTANASGEPPDPMTCSSGLPSEMTIEHRTDPSSRIHHLKLKFLKPGAFALSSDAGEGIKNRRVDGTQLLDYTEGGFASIFVKKDIDCKRSRNLLIDCADSAHGTLQVVNQAQAHLITGSDEKSQRAALACVQSIALSSIHNALQVGGNKNAPIPPLAALSEEQARVVTEQVAAISKERDLGAARRGADAGFSQWLLNPGNREGSR